MWKVFDTLLGITRPDDNDDEEEERKEEQKLDTDGEMGQHELHASDKSLQEDEPIQQQQEGGFLFSFAKTATARLTETFKGNIGGILDKTIIGDFHQEQKKFVQERLRKPQSAAAEPPWVGFSDEDTIQQQILALSVERRNFLCDPPDEVQFQFEYEEMSPVAMLMLQEDELLSQMRFALVPKHLTEDRFWRNYFYRVSLITQSAQLNSLTTPTPTSTPTSTAPSASPALTAASPDLISLDDLQIEERKSSTPPITVAAEESNLVEDEFVSDAFDGCSIDPDDLRKEMRQTLDSMEKAEGFVPEDSTALRNDSEKLSSEDS